MADTLPIDLRPLWPTSAAIPAGFTRDADFDDRYMQAAPVAGTNGGATTHTHTSTGHNHIQNAHQHSMVITGGSTGTSLGVSNFAGQGVATNGHTHNNGTSTFATGTNKEKSVTYDAVTAEPPYATVLLLIPDDGNQKIPVGAVAFADSADTIAGTDFEICDGTGGTVDFDGLFLKGAPNKSDAGGTGGALTHDHNSPAHTHDQNGHNHGTSFFGGMVGVTPVTTGTGVSLVNSSQHHVAISISTAIPTNQNTSFTTDTSSNLPAFTTFVAVQNMGATAEVPTGIILPCVGAVPDGWLPAEIGKQIRCSADFADVGVTGGSNTHTHTNPAHTHTQDAHGHSFSNGQSSAFFSNARAALSVASASHTHTSFTMGNSIAINQNATPTVSTDDIRYLYRTVIFVKKRPPNVCTIFGGTMMRMGSMAVVG